METYMRAVVGRRPNHADVRRLAHATGLGIAIDRTSAKASGDRSFRQQPASLVLKTEPESAPGPGVIRFHTSTKSPGAGVGDQLADRRFLALDSGIDPGEIAPGRTRHLAGKQSYAGRVSCNGEVYTLRWNKA